MLTLKDGSAYSDEKHGTDVSVDTVGTEIIVTNIRIPGSITLSKISADEVDEDDDPLPLAGAVFALSYVDSNGETQQIQKTTDASGTIVWSDLEWNDYTITEVTAPKGYIQYTGEIEVSVTAGNRDITGTSVAGLTVKNYQNSLTIYKVAADSAGEVNTESGVTTLTAVMTLERLVTTKTEEGTITEEYEPFLDGSYEIGALALSGIPAGTYRLTEVTAPDGYALPEGEQASLVFTMGTDGRVTISSGNTNAYFTIAGNTSEDETENGTYPNTITMANEKIKAVIVKVNEEGGALAGAIFTVTPQAGSRFTGGAESLTVSGTDTESMYTALYGELVCGCSYTVSETAVPAGYTKIDDFVLSVDAAGAVSVQKLSEDISESAKAAPDGVSCSLNSESGVYEITVEDEPIAVALTAIDGLYDGTGTSVMSGISFTLVQLDENGQAVVGTEQSVSTDSSGQIYLGAAADDNTFAVVGGQIYLLTEQSPDGYYEVYSVIITIGEDGTVSVLTLEDGSAYSDEEHGTDVSVNTAGTEITVTNIRIPGSVTLTKLGLYNETCIDVTGEDADATVPLAGVTFTAYSDETLETAVATATSDSYGQVVFENLPRGTYYLQETDTAAGYVLDDTVYKAEIVLESDTVVTTVSVKDEDGEWTNLTDNIITNDVYRSDFSFTKVSEEDSTQVLAGSTYGLYRRYSSGRSRSANSELTLIATCVSDENGLVSFAGLLMDVEYTVIELEEPSGSYLSANAISFNFMLESPDGTVTTNWISTGDDTVVEVDGELVWLEPQTIVSIEKVDEDGEPLAGATLQIQDEDGSPIIIALDEEGNPVTSWETTEEPREITGLLTAGATYILVELEAPEGYETAEPKEFTVPDDAVSPGEDTAITVTMVDLPSESEPTTPDDPVQPPTETPATPDDPDQPSTEEPMTPGAPDQPSTETPTEPVTEPSTEMPTEPVTESSTETPTEPVTEPPTEASTEAVTEPSTEPSTEPATETLTEEMTEAASGPQTETSTEMITENETLPETEVSVETEEETEAQTETAAESGTEPETESDTEDSVATGDEMQPYFWTIVMLLCALALLKAGSRHLEM